MNFLDMNQAYRNGMFGNNAKIWRDDEWSLLLYYLCGGIAHSKADWESLEWTPQVWNTEDGAKTPATKARKSWIRELAARAANADGYLRHQRSIKGFVAADAHHHGVHGLQLRRRGVGGRVLHGAQGGLGQGLGPRDQAYQEQGGPVSIARGNSLGKAKRADRAPKRTTGASSSSVATA